MGWIRVSDDFYDNDKLSEVGPLGIALYWAAVGFCNRKLSDGYFKKSKARLLLDFDGISITTVKGEFFGAGVDGDDAAKLVIEWMVAADLWHESGHDCDSCHDRADGGEPGPGEYLIHDYLGFQPSKAEVEAKAEANRKRVEAFRAARAVTNTGSNDVSNDVGNALRTPPVQDTPNPTPNPSKSSSLTLVEGGVGGNAPNLPVAAKAARGARGHRLPDSWMPPQETIDKMRKRFPAVDLKTEHEKFTNHWNDQAGAKGRKVDWIGTWCNWIIRAAEQQQPRTSYAPNGVGKPTQKAMGYQAAAERLIAGMESDD